MVTRPVVRHVQELLAVYACAEAGFVVADLFLDRDVIVHVRLASGASPDAHSVILVF